MTNRIVAWVLAGVFTFAWFWGGFVWPYLNEAGTSWNTAYLLVTLITVILLMRAPRASGTGMFDGVLHTLKLAPMMLVGLIVLMLVAVLMFQLVVADQFAVEAFIQGGALAVIAGLTTALWYGALERA